VQQVWSAQVGGRNCIDRWQNRIRIFRKKVKGWSINVEAEMKKRKMELSTEHEELDIMVETRDLSEQERDRMRIIDRELNDIWGMEEKRARQRARERNIKEGDMNTNYFHTVTNQRRRKTTIYNIDGLEGTSNTIEGVIDVATKYYKELFKYESKPNINISRDFFL
jgi:hypothetical protein